MSDMYRDSIFWVELDRIRPNPFQPRREFDEAKLQELADSIRMYGLLQPLTVTRIEQSREDGSISVDYELIAGERRLRASRIAGLAQVPVIIRSGEETDLMKLELAIIENLQREDLNPIDRARAFEKLAGDFQFKHGDIGKKVGKSREYVTNTLRLLTLPEDMQSALAEGRITEGHTRPLMMLKDKPDERAVLFADIIAKRLTVRESENLARRVAQDRVFDKNKVAPEILELEKQLTNHLGTRVHIEPKQIGGRLVINYFNADDLGELLKQIQALRDERPVSAVFDGNPALEEHKRAGEVGVDTPQDEGPKPWHVSGQGVVPGGYPMPEGVSANTLGSVAGEVTEEPAPLDDRSKDERENNDDDLYSLNNFTV